MSGEPAREVAELRVVAAVLAHPVEPAQHAARGAAARQRIVGDRRIDPGLVDETGLQARDRRLDLGCRRRRAGTPAEAGAHLRAPQPALLEHRLRLVEIAGGERHGVDAHAIELLRVILERERQQLEHVARRAVREPERELPVPARGLELGVAGAHGVRKLGGRGEGGRDGARQSLGTRRQAAGGRHGQDDGDAVDRLRVDHGDSARARRLEQAPTAVAEAGEHVRAPLRGPEQRQSGGVHRLAVERPGGPGRHLQRSELGAQTLGDVVADGLDHLGAGRAGGARRPDRRDS